MAGQRVLCYDLMKALAMFLVVFYHLKSIDFGIVPENGYYIPGMTKFLYALCSAGVPLFFMVTGALQSSKQMTQKKCIDRCVRLLLVGVFWTVLFTCVLYPLFLGRNFPTLGRLQTYCWFLYSLALVYVITFVLNKSKLLRRISIISLFIFPFLTNFVWDVIIACNPNVIIPSWGHTGFFTIYSIVYYYLGGYLIKKNFNKYIAWSLLLMGLLMVNGEVMIMSTHDGKVYDSVNSCFPTIGAMLLAVGIFSLLQHVKSIRFSCLERAVYFIGYNTLGVYVLHEFFCSVVEEYMFLQQPQNVWLVILVAMCIVVLSAYVASLIKRTALSCLLKV